MATVALAHDYATQRGGAERVALWFTKAFPDAPMYTTLYDPDGTFPEFAQVPLRVSGLNRVRPLRRHHRAALPFLAPAVARQRVRADVLLASSTGWAHGYQGADRTIVYCHAPARWLYQRERYLGPAGNGGSRPHRLAAATALALLAPTLRRWDARAAGRADLYLANSTTTQRAIAQAYGIHADVLPPPAMITEGGERAIVGVDPEYLLCVARLMPYKNVDLAIEAARVVGRPLVVVGEGPDRARLESIASRGGRTLFVGRVADDELRWLYRNASALIAASYEDYGLSPLEAGAFAVPSVALRGGGYLDTVRDGINGVFFDELDRDQLTAAIDRALATTWEPAAMAAHLDQFSADRFVAALRAVVDNESGLVAVESSREGGG